jgi:hypothetical protein
MKNGSRLREWATPLMIGAFMLSAVTGIMLFFKMDPGLIKPMHEWLSWLLVIGTVFHLTANWRFFIKCVSRPLGKGILAVFFLIICVSMIPFGEKHGEYSPIIMSNVLVRTPLSSVAQVAGHGSDEAMAMLRSEGVKIEGNEQSIGEIATKNGKPPVYVLDIIF